MSGKENMLTFASATYEFPTTATVLGFQIGMKIPDYDPVTSPQSFVIELGYTGKR